MTTARRPGTRQDILLLTADFVPGNWSGIGVAVAAQAQALRALQARVEVLWANENAPSVSRLEPETGLVVHQQGRERCAVNPAEFHVLHVHSLALTELALEMSARFDKPLVYTCHGLVSRELPAGAQRAFWMNAQRELLRRADWVVFLNTADREQACRQVSDLPTRSSVIFNGLEFAAVEPSQVTRCPGRVLFAGRWAESKGLLLLEAVAVQLLDAPGAQLIIAGGHGDSEGEAAVARMSRRHPERCQVLPWQTQPQLQALYRSAALTVLPSNYEPFGLVALEAVALGCPVIARNIGSLARIVEPGFGNALLDTSEPEAWLRALRESLGQSAVQGGLPEAFSLAVRERFSAARCAVALRELYARLIEDRAPASRPYLGQVAPVLRDGRAAAQPGTVAS